MVIGFITGFICGIGVIVALLVDALRPWVKRDGSSVVEL